MEQLRSSSFFRPFWWLMILHLFNFSVDAPDAYPDSITEDMAFNDMESIAEWALEGWLCMEDILPEGEEQESEENSSSSAQKLLFTPQGTKLPPFFLHLRYGLCSAFPGAAECAAQHAPAVGSPPPEAIA
jgi:hypothetical protein